MFCNLPAALRTLSAAHFQQFSAFSPRPRTLNSSRPNFLLVRRVLLWLFQQHCQISRVEKKKRMATIWGHYFKWIFNEIWRANVRSPDVFVCTILCPVVHRGDGKGAAASHSVTAAGMQPGTRSPVTWWLKETSVGINGATPGQTPLLAIYFLALCWMRLPGKTTEIYQTKLWLPADICRQPRGEDFNCCLTLAEVSFTSVIGTCVQPVKEEPHIIKYSLWPRTTEANFNESEAAFIAWAAHTDGSVPALRAPPPIF